ncbi:MAG TPA: FCD domain-containing protein [Hyphomicrobium sp.]|nr:FCD domain-containing protein [Hyphomicrobium sp.]
MAAVVRTPSVAEAIAGHIERLILQGALRAGEKLSAERELADMLGVSRPSLRDALALLVSRGLLTTSRSGTYVAQFMSPITKPLATLLENNSEAVQDYFEFRQSVDSLAARYAAMRANDVDREAIRNCVATMKSVHGLEDPAQEAQADFDLHLLIYDASHNLVLAHMMRALAELLRSNIFYSRKQLYLHEKVRETLLAQHIEIAEAILARKPDAAARAAANHLAFTRKSVKEIELQRARLETSLARAGRKGYVARAARRKKQGA